MQFRWATFQEAKLFIGDNLACQTEPDQLAMDNFLSDFGDIAEEVDWAVGDWFGGVFASF